MRLDAFLAAKHPEHSRSVWQKYIKLGYVMVNGQVATRTVKVGDDDKIVFDIPSGQPETLDLPIIYEDDEVVVVNKPSGLLSHSKGALNEEFTVSDFIKARAVGSDLPDNNRFGIVHRLDRGTSGVMIGAKNAAALKKLQRQFSERKTKKTYLAVVEKMPKLAAATIDLPIARNPKKPATFRVDAKGKTAVTEYKMLKTFPDGRAVLELKPQTGRTHQLRVHLAYIGAPIVGDQMYGSGSKTVSDRLLLHAKSLEITIPSGQRKVFVAQPPAQFEEKS